MLFHLVLIRSFYLLILTQLLLNSLSTHFKNIQSVLLQEQQILKDEQELERQQLALAEQKREKKEEEEENQRRRTLMHPRRKSLKTDPTFQLPPCQLCQMADHLLAHSSFTTTTTTNNNTTTTTNSTNSTPNLHQFTTTTERLNRANELYQHAIIKTHHTSTTYAIHQHPLPNTNGPPSAILPSIFEFELPLPEYIDRQQCEYITRWARGLLSYSKQILHAAFPHFDVDNPSIRQALHTMEERAAVVREHRDKEMGEKKKRRSYPLVVVANVVERQRLCLLLENEVLPHVGHARHLLVRMI